MPATPTLNTGHVGLNVTDLARSTAFYQRVFGFEAQSEPDWAFLSRDGKLVVTLWRQSKGEFEPTTPGLHQLSFQVDTVDEVRAVEAELRALGVTPLHGGVVAHREGADSGAAPTCGFF